MTTRIAQRELRNDNAKVIDAVVAGETFVVTRNGIPVAELRPIRSRRRRYVPREELAALTRSSPPVDAGSLRADLDSLADPTLR